MEYKGKVSFYHFLFLFYSHLLLLTHRYLVFHYLLILLYLNTICVVTRLTLFRSGTWPPGQSRAMLLFVPISVAAPDMEWNFLSVSHPQLTHRNSIRFFPLFIFHVFFSPPRL